MTDIRTLHGFTLIELLVAVVILSVGLLGLAGLQVTGLRSVNDSASYTQATLAVNELVERIRANPVATDNNVFAAINSTTDINCNAAPNPYCGETNGVAAAECTPAQMAAYDLNTWFCGENGVTNTLSQPVLTINCIDIDNTDADACSYGSRFTLALTWQELNPDRRDTDGDGKPDPTVTKNITLTIQQ